MLFPPRRLARIRRSARAWRPARQADGVGIFRHGIAAGPEIVADLLYAPRRHARHLSPEPGQCSTPSRSAAPIDIPCPAAATPTGGCEGPSSRRRDPAPVRICARRAGLSRSWKIVMDRSYRPGGYSGNLGDLCIDPWQRDPLAGQACSKRWFKRSEPARLRLAGNRSVILRRCRGRTAACGAASALVNPPIWLMATSDRYCIGSPSPRVRAPTTSGRREVKIE
jgi:hypothetical protein